MSLASAQQARRPIIVIGGGRMGRALIEGWRRQTWIGPILVAEPNPGLDLSSLSGDPNLTLMAGPDAQALEAIPRPLTLVVAVKPQKIDEALPPYQPWLRQGDVVISIAAGTTFLKLKAHLGLQASYIRAMPNTPAEIGCGITALVADDGVDDTLKTLAQDLMNAVGATLWCDSEAQLDAVTALSGSGPAYVYALVEAMAAAGVALGLPSADAQALARATVIGAGGLLAARADSPEALRQAVTSPGGTTAAALGVLQAGDGLFALVERAMRAAETRARQLAANG